MKVLVIGSGGRESAIVWALAQDKAEIICAPGNPGMEKYGRCVSIKANDINSLLDFAEKEKVDLTIVGPEAPLVEGIVDKFQSKRLKIFGPARVAAEIEGSKVLCKELCRKYAIPTADFEIFDDFDSARKYIEKRGAPVVVKADGLAAGKGVIVAQTTGEAIAGLESIMQKKEFGSAGSRVVAEDCLIGQECSFIVMADGETIIPLELAQDYKRVFDNDKGPNTGGMGSYSPMSALSDADKNFAMKKIIEPLLFALAKEGRPYRGAFYAGLMLTKEGIKLLEVNCRLGDPETQVILPRLASSALELFLAASEGDLKKIKPKWSRKCAVCVVLSSDGYPGKYKTGFAIKGIGEAEKRALIFHAGTGLSKNGDILTACGRVLDIVGIGSDLQLARLKAYLASGDIKFHGKHFRQDIADIEGY